MKPDDITRWTLAAELLEQVLERPADEQPGMAEELGASHGVREELSSLLAALGGGSVLDGSLEDVLRELPGPDLAPNALTGQVVGRWKLGQELGRGGMSVVYRAERTGEDFQQSGALKILSVGHLGDNFVRGFVRERQILSDLHHPGVSRLIDGGITPDGAPFFVMEFVDGERIDQWCEQRAADARMITQLMLRLCEAVAYAQEHLVVHGDIKPGNVLVDEHEQPVLIDFGIARLLTQSSTARTMRVFTPEFGAPEQRDGGPITTATDVYALGKLFRHLLGNRPVHGDLDAILHRATRDDPDQRYASARSLADDLRAWLEQRPVRARPQTRRYRAARYVARHRWAVAATVLVAASLVAGLGVAIWQADIAAGERDLARAQEARASEVTAFLQDLFRASDPDLAQGDEVTARELLDLGAHQVRSSLDAAPDLKAEMLVLLGDLNREIGEFEAAAPLLEEGLLLADDQGDLELRVTARRALAAQRMDAGLHDEALALAEEAEQLLADAGRVPGALHATLVQPILFSLTESGRVPEAAERGERLLEAMNAAPDLSASARFQYLHRIGNALLIAEREAEAEGLFREAIALSEAFPADASAMMALHSDMGGVFHDQGLYEDAVAQYSRALDIAEQIYPREHTWRARQLSNLGSSLVSMGRVDDAELMLVEALAIYDAVYGTEAHPRVAAANNNLGRMLEEAGRYASAEPYLVRAREMARTLFGTADPRYVLATGNLGNLYREAGNLEQAEPLLQESLDLRIRLLGPEHRIVGTGQGLLAALRLDQGRFAEALQLIDEALTIYDQAGFDNPRAMVAALSRKAEALAGLGRASEARTAFEQALLIADEQPDDTGTQRCELLAAYAQFLDAQDDPEAPRMLARAMDVHREMLGPDHPDTRELANRISG